MTDSVWTGTIDAYRGRVGGSGAVPAGVSVSAVSASLALALLAKVLDITGRRKSFNGDRELLARLIGSAREQSSLLTRLADEDIAAFDHYRECLRDGTGVAAAARKAIEIPLAAARASVRGLALCVDSIGMIRGLTAADLGTAAALLSGAVQALLLSVDFNVRQMQVGEDIVSERRQLEAEGQHLAHAVASSIAGQLGA